MELLSFTKYTHSAKTNLKPLLLTGFDKNINNKSHSIITKTLLSEHASNSTQFKKEYRAFGI